MSIYFHTAWVTIKIFLGLYQNFTHAVSYGRG